MRHERTWPVYDGCTQRRDEDEQWPKSSTAAYVRSANSRQLKVPVEASSSVIVIGIHQSRGRLREPRYKLAKTGLIENC
jgi:hypothetical protein